MSMGFTAAAGCSPCARWSDHLRLSEAIIAERVGALPMLETQRGELSRTPRLASARRVVVDLLTIPGGVPSARRGRTTSHVDPAGVSATVARREAAERCAVAIAMARASALDVLRTVEMPRTYLPPGRQEVFTAGRCPSTDVLRLDAASM